MKYFIHLPMKMEPIVSSETSAIRTQTPGNYPKRNKLQQCSSLKMIFRIETCWSDFKCFNVKNDVCALVGVLIKCHNAHIWGEECKRYRM